LSESKTNERLNRMPSIFGALKNKLNRCTTKIGAVSLYVLRCHKSCQGLHVVTIDGRYEQHEDLYGVRSVFLIRRDHFLPAGPLGNRVILVSSANQKLAHGRKVAISYSWGP
jgi:hypothetical protein